MVNIYNKSKKFNKDYIFIFFIGIFTSFSLPPYNYWLINFFTFSILFFILHKNLNNSFKSHFIYGYCFGFGYFISSLYWIPFSLLYDENFKFLTPIAIIVIPLFLSFFYAIAFSLSKMFFRSNNIFANVLIFSLFLGIVEFLRGNILSGFPWNLFIYSLSKSINIIQINSIIGVYAFNTILITIFSSPAILYLDRQKKNIYFFSSILGILLIFYLFGLFKLKNFNNLDDHILSSNIKVLSTSIPIERFYKQIDDEKILIKLIKQSDPNLNENTLFIWPEGVIPNLNLKDLRNEYNYIFEKSFSDKHIIILGINDEEKIENIKKYYNSLSIIDNKANVLYKYYKNKLVPFGEFIPMENLLSKLGFKSLTNNYNSYSAGSERNLFSFKKDIEVKILPLICYEIIYSGKLSKDNEFTFIVNISEDGWFGNSIGPSQHFVHTIFRSIEYGKYTLRSANNGISAIIDPTGLIIDKLNMNKEGVISINQIKKVDKTIFSKFGNKIYFLIILLYIFLIFSFKKSENE
tara:strand:+ start:18182 stop:19741 length:1560 start_codon:yes stop_codon:yes gene_type:complete